jgi:hypothetical protein
MTMTYEKTNMGHSYFKHIYNPSSIQKSFEKVILGPSWFRAAYGPKSGRALDRCEKTQTTEAYDQTCAKDYISKTI